MDPPSGSRPGTETHLTWNQHSLYLKTAHSISLTPIAKRPSVAPLFFENSPLRPDCSRLISTAGLSSTRTSRGNFTPTTAAKADALNSQLTMFSRRRSKLIGFIITETSAIGALLLAGIFALTLKPTDPTLILLINIVTIVAAAAVAIIPIAFFAIRPILPRGER